MKLKNYLSILLATGTLFLGTSSSFAQYVTKETFMETSGVSSQGIVSGYEVFAGPYFLWNPDEETTEEIGGAAPGNGVGGKAHFSNDGNLISGSMFVTTPVTPQWERTVLEDYNYIFTKIEFPDNWTGYAVGQSVTYQGDGIVLRTDDSGNTWMPMWEDTDGRGLESMSFPESYVGYVGGWNGYFAKTVDGGWNWEEQNPGGGDNVWYYTAISFKDNSNGIVGAMLEDDPFTAVYYTMDGGSTWSVATGISGAPSKIIHVTNSTYFAITDQNVFKSTNDGATWTEVHTISTPWLILAGINFYDENTGIVVGEEYIAKTTDGGTTWEEGLEPGIGGLWRDVNWVGDSNHVLIVGTPDFIYESTDGGNTWSWANEDLFDGSPALYSIAMTEETIHVCGSQGNFYKKSLLTSITHSEMGRYSTSTGEWSELGDLGYQIDISTSSGYSISADGTTVVGNSYTETGSAHAVAWTETDGIIDLGSLYEDRNTRADAISNDGNVIVGWQDFNGPWKSAVWRKNSEGGYSPNEYLLVDPDGDPTDEYNQLGQASAVSADGNWIGGYGDYAFPNAWIWNEDMGLIDIGDMDLEEGTVGHVTAINHDGSIVIGWYQFGGGPWDPPVYTPFIWTPELGAQNLNTFITETLEYDMGGDEIYVPIAMSSNGEYISGWSFNPQPEPWGEYHTFRLQLTEWLLNIEETNKISFEFYPNPTSGVVNISSESNINSIEVYNVTGQTLFNKNPESSNFKIDLSQYNPGIYFVKLNANNTSQTFKVVKN